MLARKVTIWRAQFCAHPDAVAALVHDDLRANEATRQTRGLLNLRELPTEFWDRNREIGKAQSPLNARWFDTIYKDVEHVFQNAPPAAPADSNTNLYYLDYNTPLKAHAEGMLVQLGDARAIALLIHQNAANPTRHYWAIAGLARQHPGDAALQTLAPLLRSDDAESRYGALYALPADDAATATALPVLLEDAAAKIRALAVFKALLLKGADFEKVRAELKNRLTDADVNVRLKAAVGLAERGDGVAAPVLLKLWREEKSDSQMWQAKSALAKLTGENLGGPFARDANGKTPFYPDKAEAMARVEAWIAAHPAN